MNRICESCERGKEMSKYKQNGKKSERISVRCTKKEKQQLLDRANSLEMEFTEYIRTILLSRGPYKNVTGNDIELIIEIQDLITHIKKLYHEDDFQEEIDRIWRKIKRSL